MANNSSNALDSSNGTSNWSEQPGDSNIYEWIFSVTTMLVIAVVVFSLGCTLEAKKVWGNLKRPWGIAVGMVCQFGLMPLVAYILAVNLATTAVDSIAILILGCCPGGTLSNIITSWIDGDMDLSITMTASSTLAALGMMPLCLYVFTHSWELADGLTIPYQTIGTSLLSLIIPVACGICANYRWPKHSKIIVKVGRILGVVFLVVVSVINILLFKGSWNLDISLVIVSAVLPLAGYVGGFLLALITLQSWARCRTIAVETGTQNMALYGAMLQLSMRPQHFVQIFILPILYSAFQVLNGLLVIAVYQIYKKRLGQREEENVPEPQVSIIDLWGSGQHRF